MSLRSRQLAATPCAPPSRSMAATSVATAVSSSGTTTNSVVASKSFGAPGGGGGGKHIQQLMQVPYNFALKRQPAGEITFAVAGQVTLDANSTTPCTLKGNGIAFEDLQRNPFQDSFYALFYPDASGSDLFYKLVFSYGIGAKGVKNQRVLYLSADQRFLLCTLQDAVAAAIAVIQQSDSSGDGVSETPAQNGDFISVGNHAVVHSPNEVRFQSDHLGIRSQCFVLLTVDETYKLLLYVYKYAEGANDFLIELKYVEATGGETDEDDYENAHVFASLAIPMALYTSFQSLHSGFNAIEQGYYIHLTEGRGDRRRCSVAAPPPQQQPPPPLPPTPHKKPTAAAAASVSSISTAADSLFEDLLDMQQLMQQPPHQTELNYMHAAAASKKRQRSAVCGGTTGKPTDTMAKQKKGLRL